MASPYDESSDDDTVADSGDRLATLLSEREKLEAMIPTMPKGTERENA
jgi:hypothetical protein